MRDGKGIRWESLLIACALWLALATAAGPAPAQSDQAMDARLDALFGAHAPYARFLDRLQDAVAAGDRQAVAAMVAYPLATTIGGERVTLASASDLVRDYDQLFTPALAAAVAQQTYATLFANTEGVMIGSGEVWFGGVCADAACSAMRVRIIALNPPDEPGDADRAAGPRERAC